MSPIRRAARSEIVTLADGAISVAKAVMTGLRGNPRSIFVNTPRAIVKCAGLHNQTLKVE
jgi:hypothetical protein